MASQFGKSRNTPAGRRRHSRLRLSLPARVITLTGSLSAMLLDMSLTGARIELARPLRPGADIMLSWEHWEIFGSIAWCEKGNCGIDFERPLPPNVLLSTREIADARAPVDPGVAAKAWATGESSR